MFSSSLGGREVTPGTYKRLMRNEETIMSNTPAEIDDLLEFIYAVKKHGTNVLINGLGLGVALTAVLKNEKVQSVTVVELSQDVIDLVGPTYKDPRVEIIHADALKFTPPKNKRYSHVWHDIWDNICEDNLPDMHKLHRKYGRRCDWQGSWCRYDCEHR